jgi:hypothetical protein
MSLSAQISISADNATPAVAELMSSVQPRKLAMICRDPLRAFWRDRLKKYPRLPGPFAGFPPTGFGEEAADSVQGIAGEGTVILTANKQGLRLRYEGGEVTPTKAKCLCFGITPESYGKSPYQFGLVVGQKPSKDVRALISKLFAFARKVTFLPNLEVVPTSDEFQEVAMAAISRSLDPVTTDGNKGGER